MQDYVHKIENHSPSTRFFRRALLCIILLEIFLGGGGRLLDIGALSVRMYFFGLALAIGICVLVYRPVLQKRILVIMLLHFFIITIGVIVAISNNAAVNLILEDIKPLMFVLSLIFLIFLIHDETDVILIGRLLRIASLILAVIYLLLLLLIHTQSIPFRPFYNWAYGTQEFFFRGQFAFFYKGFFFMCTGMFFYRWNASIGSKVAMLIILSAVMLTFTRGFVLAFYIVVAIDLVLIRRRLDFIILFFLLTLLAAPFIWKFVSNEEMIDRQTSNNNRISQIVEVASETTLKSTIFGHGFGRNIPSREDLHLEISYLEIFYKQGIIGLMFWFYFFVVIFKLYKKAAVRDPVAATPFFLAVLFTYIQSFTNPFLNNPLGLTLLIISMISLQILSSKKSDQPASDHFNDCHD
jgi:hypothetical protein